MFTAYVQLTSSRESRQNLPVAKKWRGFALFPRDMSTKNHNYCETGPSALLPDSYKCGLLRLLLSSEEAPSVARS
jgi:hypothetical protein